MDLLPRYPFEAGVGGCYTNRRSASPIPSVESSLTVAHIVYVDLSAKMEQWNRDSAIAVSNDHCTVCLVPAKVKQRLRRRLIEAHDGKSTHYRALAILIYMMVKDNLADITRIVIDKDYTGRQAEATIKNLLLQLLRRERPGLTGRFVQFDYVAGRAADVQARAVFRRERQPDRVLRFAEIAQALRG